MAVQRPRRGLGGRVREDTRGRGGGCRALGGLRL